MNFQLTSQTRSGKRWHCLLFFGTYVLLNAHAQSSSQSPTPPSDEASPTALPEPSLKTVNHIRITPRITDAASIFLAARLTKRLDQLGVQLPTPEAPNQTPDRLQLSTLGVFDIADPRWQVEARFQPGKEQIPALAWESRQQGFDGIVELARETARHLAAARGQAEIDFLELPAARTRQVILGQLLDPGAQPEPENQLLLIAELCELCLRHPAELQALFAPENQADPSAPTEQIADTPTCAWLELRIHPLTRANPAQALLLDELLLPRAIDHQLLDARPSLALLCFGLTQPARLGANLQALNQRQQFTQLKRALDRTLDPELQPHWPQLRGQLRTGLLLADRYAPPRSPYCRALREAVADSTDGDDLLLSFAIALHHLDPVPADLRQQSADALWQARPLWNRYPGFRTYLQALAADITHGLEIPPIEDLPDSLKADTIPPEWLLPALLSQ